MIKLDGIFFPSHTYFYRFHCAPTILVYFPFLQGASHIWPCIPHSVSLSCVFFHLSVGWFLYFPLGSCSQVTSLEKSSLELLILCSLSPHEPYSLSFPPCLIAILYSCYFLFDVYLFIYWLHSVAACGLSLAVGCWDDCLVACAGFSLWWLLLLQSAGPVVLGCRL